MNIIFTQALTKKSEIGEVVGGIIYAQVPRLAIQITYPAPRLRSKTSYGSCDAVIKLATYFGSFLTPGRQGERN